MLWAVLFQFDRHMIATHSKENFLLMIVNFKRKKKSIRIVSPFQKAGDFIEEDKRPPVPFVSENEDPLNLSVAECQRSSLVLYKGY